MVVELGQSFLCNLNDVDYLGTQPWPSLFHLHFYYPLYDNDHVRFGNKIYPGYMTIFWILSLSHNCLYYGMWLYEMDVLGSWMVGMGMNTNSGIWFKSSLGSRVSFALKVDPNQGIEIHIPFPSMEYD